MTRAERRQRERQIKREKKEIEKKLRLRGIKDRKVEVTFGGECVVSDAGLLIIRELENKINFIKLISKSIEDTRHQSYTDHSIETMLKQRVFGIIAGYEDVTDHNELRKDEIFKTAINKEEDLASGSTLSRFENRITHEENLKISEAIVEDFVQSFKGEVPTKLILDFDATDDLIHGAQENKYFNGYYDHYCFLPLYVFCGQKLLVSYLRSANREAAHGSWAILGRLVKRFRKEWPKVRIIFRADSGFCRHRMMDWCDSHDVEYIVGIGKNPRLNTLAHDIIETAKKEYEKTKKKVRLFDEFNYAAESWNRERRVIVKAERLADGKENTRYVVTNVKTDIEEKDEKKKKKLEQKYLYDELYTARGDMENRIKEQQLYLFADRTSCHEFNANRFRLLLASLAYILLEKIRSGILKTTELAKAQCSTIRLKLIKIGAIIIKNTKRILVKISESYPFKNLFWKIIYSFQ